MISRTLNGTFAFGGRPGVASSGPVSAVLYMHAVHSGATYDRLYYYATNPLNISAGQQKTFDYNRSDEPIPTLYNGLATSAKYFGNNTIVVGSVTSFGLYAIQTSTDGGLTFNSNYPNLPGAGTLAFNAGTYALGYHWLVIGVNLYKTTDFTSFTQVTLPTANNVRNIAIMGNIIVLGVQGGITVSLDGGASWAFNNTISGFTNASTNNYAYTNGSTFLIKNTSRNMRSSTDGVTWNATSFASGGNPADPIGTVASGNGLWIMAGTQSLQPTSIVLSTDGGSTWTNTTAPLDRFGNPFRLASIDCLNGLFVASSDYGDVFTTTDGVTWTGQVVVNATYRGTIVAYNAP